MLLGTQPLADQDHRSKRSFARGVPPGDTAFDRWRLHEKHHHAGGFVCWFQNDHHHCQMYEVNLGPQVVFVGSRKTVELMLDRWTALGLGGPKCAGLILTTSPCICWS